MAKPVDGFLKINERQYASGIEAKPNKNSIKKSPTDCGLLVQSRLC